jgi:hypothetical protein
MSAKFFAAGGFGVTPPVRVLYLLAVALGLVLARTPGAIAVLAGTQVALWFLAGLSASRLLRQIVRFWGFALLIVASYALVSDDPAVDRWVRLPLGAYAFSLNLGGIADGLLMVARIVLMIISSQIARAGDPRAIAAGLTSLRVPPLFAVSVDAVLALLGEQGMSGRGRGTGGGRGRGGGRNQVAVEGQEDQPSGSFRTAIRRLGQGDVSPLVARLQQHIARVETYAASQVSEKEGRVPVRDVAVIAGVSLTMLGIKAVKTLPGLPFAPGHKMVVLLPLYVVAARLTGVRFGATYTGLTMGTVAFLMGDGRYGIFEILKHVTPGLLCDLILPLMLAAPRSPGRLAWSLFGSIVGAGRFATVFAIVLAAQPPAVAYAILLPGLATDVVFGFLSGYVTFHVVRAVDRVREEYDTRKKEAAWANS